jgi:hypothetical protein
MRSIERTKRKKNRLASSVPRYAASYVVTLSRYPSTRGGTEEGTLSVTMTGLPLEVVDLLELEIC